MPTVAFLSWSDLRFQDRDLPPLRSALADRSVATSVIDWHSAGECSDADLVVIRSTWDYYQHLPDFLAALDLLDDRVVNPLSVVKWNSHKQYLVELADAGVPVVPTTLVRQDAGRDSRVAAIDAVSGPMVIKPAVSAGAHHTARFDVDDPAAAKHLDLVLANGDSLVQPLVDLAIDGERSLMFLGGSYSHTIRKIPQAGDFRVQHQFGGVEQLTEASPAELAVAQQALGLVPAGTASLLYARVDLAGPPEAPLLMELELIEPQLFLDRFPAASGQLADAIVVRLSKVRRSD